MTTEEPDGDPTPARERAWTDGDVADRSARAPASLVEPDAVDATDSQESVVSPPTGDSGERRQVDPAFVPCERFSSWIVTLVLAPLALLAIAMIWLFGWFPVWLRVVLTAAAMAKIAGLLWLTLRWPRRVYDHLWYRVHDDGIEIWKGVIWRSVTSVPRSRVQHTDVAQGPVERRFGLAHLVIHTAGSHEANVALGGLRHEDALRIRDLLIDHREEDDVEASAEPLPDLAVFDPDLFAARDGDDEHG